MLLSVIVPAFNEGKHIAKNLQLLLEVLGTSGLSYEIIVVSDGSKDNTVEEALKLSPTRRVKVFHYLENKGKGYALKYGYERCIGKYVCFIDSDLDLHPKSINDFIDVLILNNLDIVIGSKRHPESKVHYPKSRRMMSFVYYKMVALLFGLNVTDTQTGIKLFKREVLEKVLPRILVKRYAFDVELLSVANRMGFGRIYEAPIILQYRFSGTGINVKSIIQMLVDTAAIFYRLRVIKYYDKKFITDSRIQLERYRTS